MARAFGFGVVGAGLAAAPHFSALRDLAPDVAVRGVVSRDPNRRAAAQAAGFVVQDSLAPLLVDPAVDALLVLTPPDTRLAIVQAAVAAGKHLLLEKPLERDAGAAAQIVTTCAGGGVQLGVIFQHRYRDAAMVLRGLLDRGALGAICSVNLQVPWWRPQSYYDAPGRGTKARDGGGVLLTQAIHLLDLMLWLAGPVAEVQAMLGTTRHRMETEDFASAALRFESGALGAVMATTAQFPGGVESLVLSCRDATALLVGGVLTLHWTDGRVEVHGAEVASGSGAGVMDFPYIWHRAQIAEFVDAVRAGRAPASNGQNALAVQRLIEAMVQSSAHGQRETV